jgi:RimJ/RimL family protein N-acetyltransferase
MTPDLRVGGTVEFGFGANGTVTDLDPPRFRARMAQLVARLG